ncbi:MAG: AAC(3) family N-acetyltransferase [Actinomycetota bacterium]
MTFDDARSLLMQIFDDLDVRTGDTIHLSTDMGRVPLPKIAAPLTREGIRGREQQWCEFLLATILERLGPTGTLIVPTATNSYARHGTPYVHEESPAETGPFCEFVRTRPQTVRSLHPLISLSGIGPAAPAILNDVGKNAFGSNSPYARFGAHGVKFVFLGTGVQALTYGYHLQQLYGVNHMYTKLFNTPVFRGGQEVPGPWLCSLRYLGPGIQSDFVPLEKRLRSEGCLRESALTGQPMQAATVADIDRIGYRMLEENPWSFITEPVEIHVAAPGSVPQSASRRAAYLVWSE